MTILILGVVLAAPGLPAIPPAGSVACTELDVKVKVTDTSNNQDNGEVDLEYSQSTDTYSYFIFSGDEQANQLNGTGTKISNLKRGTYNLYVQNQDGCTKHFKLKIN